MKDAVSLEAIPLDKFKASGWSTQLSEPELNESDFLVLNLSGRPVEWIAMRPLAWDTQVLKLKCARLVAMSDCGEPAPLGCNLYGPLTEHFKKMGFEYITVRRPATGDWARVQALEDAGFRLVDGLHTFSKRMIDIAAANHSLNLRLATPSDAERVAELSATNFTLSRFHNDPLLTDQQRRQVHYEWGKNSCLGIAAKAVWLSESGSHLEGFVTCKTLAATGVIELVAVSPSSVGRGVGSALVGRATEWFNEQGCTEVRVQTQIDNLGAIRLYTKMGFSIHSTDLTLRWAAAGK